MDPSDRGEGETEVSSGGSKLRKDRIFHHTKRDCTCSPFFCVYWILTSRCFCRDHSVRSAMTGSFLDADLDGINPPIMVRTVAMMTRATAA